MCLVEVSRADNSGWKSVTSDPSRAEEPRAQNAQPAEQRCVPGALWMALCDGSTTGLGWAPSCLQPWQQCLHPPQLEAAPGSCLFSTSDGPGRI